MIASGEDKSTFVDDDFAPCEAGGTDVVEDVINEGIEASEDVINEGIEDSVKSPGEFPIIRALFIVIE